MVALTFDRGSLLLRGLDPALAERLPEARADGRLGGAPAVRVPAHHYHSVVRLLVGLGIGFEDRAQAYERLDLATPDLTPRPYQLEAVAAWRAAGRRGLVVLPTGTGKTVIAQLAIADTGRSTLVVVPTLDLLAQWHDGLAARFGEERVGAIGGGTFEPRPLTVITYDSAYLHLERLGDRFGLLVCDEVHHLPGPSFVQGARMALAPFRLGLTATPPEAERLAVTEGVVGPIVFQRGIGDLAGEFLSTYEVVRVEARLDPEEQAAYAAARADYRGFLAREGIRLGGRHGWARFLRAACRSEEGRRALLGWREQRRIAMGCRDKMAHLEAILARHAQERVLVFTHENEAAYEVSRRFLVPVITHQTRPRERRVILAGLRAGTTPVIATSRVLNEGVDVPAVGVGVVLSGSATVREHVQRLGRLLRRVEGKHAVLYEVVTADTSEVAASARRREHDAYR